MKLDFLNLKQRIAISFGLFLVLFLALSALASTQQKSQVDQSRSAQRISESKLQHNEIRAMVREIHYRIQAFTTNGQISIVQRLRRKTLQLKNMIEQARAQSDHADSQRLLSSMLPLLESYTTNMDFVAKERAKRDVLVQDDFMETLTDCNLQFKTIIKEIDSKEEALKLELMTLDINHAEIELFQYLNNYDQNHINIAMERLEEASEKVVKLSRPSHVRLLSKHIQQLRTSILNISQVIQGYLYFANVVMAADASELLYQAKGLDEVSTQRQRAIQDDVLNVSSRSLKIILIFCLVVFCLSIVLTIVLGRSITTPIDQLKETFSSLSSGKRVDVIPCIDARNELGELARSANVFKQKNEETKLLLQESKTLTQELKTRETELAKSNDELEQFVFTVSHDLKSPLVTSIGYISMAKDVLEDGDVARGVELMGRVMKANERMSQLITDLLDLSRVGREEDEFLEVSIYNCLASVKGNLAHSISSNNVKLVIEDNLPSVYGHESRLMQVFENLIGNAIKYGAPEEGQPIVKVSHVSGSETIHITIEDKGKGIPKEYHKKVFGLFSRLDHEKEGTGIGLAVVKKVMTSHGGKVWIENGLNGGSSFHLEFPRRQIEKS